MLDSPASPGSWGEDLDHGQAVRCQDGSPTAGEKDTTLPGKGHLAVIMLILYTVYLVPIFKGCATLFQGMIGVSYLEGLLITVAIVAIYYSIGGLPAIIWVGFIQGVLMLIGAVFLRRPDLRWWRPGYLGENSLDVLSMNGLNIPWQQTFGQAFSISLGLLASRSADYDILRPGQEGRSLRGHLRTHLHRHLCSVHLLPGNPGLWSIERRADSSILKNPTAWCHSSPH